MASTIPLNTRQPAPLVERVRADARRSRRSIDTVMETIIAEFFKARSLKDRMTVYGTKPPKRGGRPQEAEVAS